MGMVYDITSARVTSFRDLKFVLFGSKSKLDASVIWWTMADQ